MVLPVDRTVLTSLPAASGPNCDTEYHHGMAMPATDGSGDAAQSLPREVPPEQTNS